MNTDIYPFVSVIIPVHNDPGGVEANLFALQKQTYPGDQFEVIVVDNDSSDHTPEVVRQFDARLCFETEHQSSYAARNAGIQVANGEFLAFTDADCVPAPDWLENSVATLVKTEADILAGRVEFQFTSSPTASERYDALVNMRNDRSVKDGIGKTANLVVRKSVLDSIGPFPEQLRSGGDVHWTSNATQSGFELVYESRAVVLHPSRQLTSLLRKQYRVGRGQIQMWRLENKSIIKILLLGLLVFPLKVLQFTNRSDESTPGDRGADVDIPKDRQVINDPWVKFVAGFCMVSMSVGRLVELIDIRKL